MFTLPADIYLAAVGDSVIILDTTADRYRRLIGLDAQVLQNILGGSDISDGAAAERLVRRGLLRIDGVGRPAAPVPLADPTIDLETMADDFWPISRPLSRLVVALALGAAQYELSRRGLRRALARAERRAAGTRPDNEAAGGVALAFAGAMRCLPLTARCLRDCLALHRLSAARGLRTDFVIGVADRPFLAHSWLQAGPILLTGSLEQVRPFSPILVL